MRIMDREGLDRLLEILRSDGWQVLGPMVRDEVIVNGEIETAADLPIGWTDEQDGGRYRLRRRDDDAVFGYAVGPDSWKRLLHPPEVRLWSARRNAGSFQPRTERSTIPKRALLGVRPCELQAIRVLDRVLLDGPFTDPVYRERRDCLLVIAVNCTEPAGTCFCASVGAGPAVATGYDLVLTELLEDGHRFAVDSGSEAGAALLDRLTTREAKPADESAAQAAVARAAHRMGRRLDGAGLHERLAAGLEHPRWEKVAERCLACGNCTMVCPTCFCTTTRDASSLAGDRVQRVRSWDSCFTQEYSHMHGGSVRATTASRYRQWLTHKLGSWQDQFGMIGCVGCGRCITWCPVGIDLTDEAAALRTAISSTVTTREEAET